MDVVADMLAAARTGARQTAIMYQANLSYNLLTVYLHRLVENKLLTEKDSRGLFHVSIKGMRYLREYRRYEELSESLSKKRATILALLQ